MRDWCISRQLWWGQRIPAYYLPDGEFVVEATLDEAFEAAKKINPNIKREELKQDDDVLDTWFSSWLWPISVFDPEKPGFPDKEPNKDLAYYYPTNDLITAPEILFFWVARMVMAADVFTGKVPFRNVYLTGIVRDKLGRKMSKSLGNSPDPIKLMQEYGADGVRIGMLLCTSAGNDILFDESQVEQGRNFANKIWNAFRLTRGWEVDGSAKPSAAASLAMEWFEGKLNKSVAIINDHFSKFRIADATMTVYKLFWDDFCAWYLEAVKPAFGAKIDRVTYDKTMTFFDSLLKMLHPFMPFITEELWQSLTERKDGETIMLQQMPAEGQYSEGMLSMFDAAEQTVMNIRNIRQSRGISPKESVELYVKEPYDVKIAPVIEKLANVSGLKLVREIDKQMQGMNFMVGTTEFFVPLKVNAEEEVKKIKEEIKRYTIFLVSVEKKLSNANFVKNAPQQVVDIEKKKQNDAQTKLNNLNELLQRFK